jgi:cell division protein FtsI (penicillin-binding protein 3)
MIARTTNDRLGLVFVAFVALLAAVWARCAWLQVLGGDRLARYARSQHWTSRPLVAQRGTIYDRHGRVLAVGARAPSVFADAKRVVEKDRTARQVADVLGKDPKSVRRRLGRDKRFVWVARQVDPSLTPAIAKFRRQGIGIIEEAKRVYPQGRLAGHILGYVDIDQNGLEGLELAYNGLLRGYTGWVATLRDAKGDLLLGPWTRFNEPTTGCNLVLTLDSVVQATAEESLAWGVKQFNAKGGAVVVMDPHTGQLLGLASWPDFDPNHPARVGADARRLRAITDMMEPGSIFKVVTAAALLEEGKITPADRIFCEEGKWPTIGHHVLHDHRPHGWLTFHDVIALSSNIGTVKAARRLDPDTLYRYIRMFGFGQKTGVELRGEVSGMLAPPSRWSKLTPYIIPMGQEVAATPIQVATMVSIIANRGWRVRPYVVERIETAGGEVVREFASHRSERLLQPQTIEELDSMMVSVVESGTGQSANIAGLTVAGKTGTAQKLEPNGRYSHSRYIASFVGYGPVPDPRFVIVVMIDEPRPLYFGGVVAAPIFRRVVESLAGYWGLKNPLPPQLVARSY